jgi:plastocyanin
MKQSNLSMALTGALTLSAALFALQLAPPASGSAAGQEAQETPPVAGKIRGKVSFEGERKEPKPLTISAEQSKGCCAEGESVDPTDRGLLVAEEGGIANAVVSIQIEGRKPKVPDEPVSIDQVGCRFEPHVLVLPVGGKVEYRNSDQVSHNVHTYGFKNENLNKTVGAGGNQTQVLDQAEPFKIACDLHPWMSAWIYVTDASVWAITGADGSFELPALPPGEYEIDVWHETLGKTEARATIAADGSCESVEIGMKPKKPSRRRRR